MKGKKQEFSLGKEGKKTGIFPVFSRGKKTQNYVFFPREEKNYNKYYSVPRFPHGQSWGKVVVRQLTHDDSFP